MSMEGTPVPPQQSGGFQELIKRFWGFDHLIGSALIKIIYYIGLVVILITTVLAAGGLSMVTMPVIDPVAWTPPCSGTAPASTNAPTNKLAASTAPVPVRLSMCLL